MTPKKQNSKKRISGLLPAIHLTELLFSFTLVLLFISFTSCKKDGVTEPTYPIIIPFEEYNPNSINRYCYWNPWSGFSWDYEDYYSATLTVINSNEELGNYILCHMENNYPEIDFSKYSLILVNGFYNYCCSITKCLLQQTSVNEYQLDIEMRYYNEFDASTNWVLALIVDKLPKENNIELFLNGEKK